MNEHQTSKTDKTQSDRGHTLIHLKQENSQLKRADDFETIEMLVKPPRPSTEIKPI